MARTALFKENVILAVEALARHKFRAFLTVLGVFIGVLVIVCVASVLNGFRRNVIAQVEEFGTNNIYVYRYPFIHMGHLPAEVRNRKPLTLEDALAIRKRCPSVRYVSAGIQLPFLRSRVSYAGEEVERAQVRGVLCDSEFVSNITIREGRFFTEAEDLRRATVCVIGYNIADALFPTRQPVGHEVEIDGRRYRVVGMAEKRKEGPFGVENDEDYVIEIPYNTIHRYYPWLDDHFVAIQAHEGKLAPAVEEITELLRRRRHVRYDEDNNFEIGTATSIIETFDQIIFAAVAVMFTLSAVAFVVGGVGVMNIMMLAVRERTGEIGLRKAIGARRKDITLQFLTEAAVLTGAGGILGLLAGESLMLLVAAAVPTVPVSTPLWARLFGFFGSASVGLFFGLLPALRAARLDPIEALRHE
jgi:putative ABC transport system permease protein